MGVRCGQSPPEALCAYGGPTRACRNGQHSRAERQTEGGASARRASLGGGVNLTYASGEAERARKGSGRASCNIRFSNSKQSPAACRVCTYARPAQSRIEKNLLRPPRPPCFTAPETHPSSAETVVYLPKWHGKQTCIVTRLAPSTRPINHTHKENYQA